MTATPNTTLKAVRLGMMLSQDEFARRLREAGADGASKRLVQRWEAGETVAPRPAHARALEAVTGLPVALLGFRVPAPAEGEPPAPIPAGAGGGAPRGNYSGIWLSEYEYESSSRGATFTGRHHVLVLQHGDRLSVRSLPDTARGELTMDLTVDGQIITGTWVEVTAKDGYYRGARYHGAIQLVADTTGRRMAGRWVGFNREMGVDTGPWTLTFLDPSTDIKALERYNHPPQD